MSPELKQKWIDALESGKYIHGKNRLKIIEDGCVKHCCLGVLVDVLGHEILTMDTDCGDGLGPTSKTEFNRIKINDQKIGYEFFNELMPQFRAQNLYQLNDLESTVGYEKQIAYIKEKL